MSGIYTAPHLEELRQALQTIIAGWGLSSQTRLTLLNTSENATFLGTDPCRPNPVVFRVHRPGYHELDEIRSELAWIDAIRQDGIIETPAIVRLHNGEVVAQLQTPTTARHVVAFEYMTGQEPQVDLSLLPRFNLLGAISARLHLYSRAWRRPVWFRRKTWDLQTTIGTDPHWGDWRDAPGLTVAGTRLLTRCVAQLHSQLGGFGTDANRFGLIHADLRLANLLDDGHRLGVIDFDDCGFSWYLYDFAAAVSFLETEPLIPDLAAAWAEGYRSVTPLPASEEAWLPVFVMLRRIVLTAWLARHEETTTGLRHARDYTAGTLDLAEAYLSRPAESA